MNFDHRPQLAEVAAGGYLPYTLVAEKTIG
jgi:hypothetical protein